MKTIYKDIRSKICNKIKTVFSDILSCYYLTRITGYSLVILDTVNSKYPYVIGEIETIEKIVQDKCSIARFGDGELSLCLGKDISCQRAHKKLITRLREVLRSDDENILIAIPRSLMSNDYWKCFALRNGKRVIRLLDNKITYYSANVTRRPSWISGEELTSYIRLLRQIWDRRKVLFVVGEGSNFVFDEDLFDNIGDHRRIYGLSKNAFDEYDNIRNYVLNYPKEYLVLIALGPTATVLAYDLAKKGYQAIDIGHLPNCYRTSKYGVPKPENRTRIR